MTDGGPPPIAVAGELLVALDANDPTAGSATWVNAGTLGDFNAMGKPAVGSLGSVRAVQFDGTADAYVGPASVPSIEGAGDRSIEIWVNNPTIDSVEEAMVSWSDRGGSNGTMMSFNYGTSSYYGAVTHWSPDLGWGPGGSPASNQWHHLAYTYDGTTARVYEDGVEKNAKAAQLATKANLSINLAAERNGAIQFKDEFYDNQQAGSLWIAIVRIHDGALTPAQIQANFTAELSRFR
jgi:Concanavalin A-like lectin/glucanases superfamily